MWKTIDVWRVGRVPALEYDRPRFFGPIRTHFYKRPPLVTNDLYLRSQDKTLCELYGRCFFFLSFTSFPHGFARRVLWLFDRVLWAVQLRRDKKNQNEVVTMLVTVTKSLRVVNHFTFLSAFLSFATRSTVVYVEKHNLMVMREGTRHGSNTLGYSSLWSFSQPYSRLFIFPISKREVTGNIRSSCISLDMKRSSWVNDFFVLSVGFRISGSRMMRSPIAITNCKKRKIDQQNDVAENAVILLSLKLFASHSSYVPMGAVRSWNLRPRG